MAVTGNLAEVVLHHDYGGADQFECVFGFQAISESATFANLASAFKTAVVKNTSGGFFNGHQDVHGSASLTVVDVVPGTGARYDHTYTRVSGGTTVERALAPLTCAVIKWTTALAGRSYRGRTFINGWNRDTDDAGVWDTGVVSQCDAFRDALLGAFGISGSDTNWQFVVISRRHNGVPRVTPIGTPVVTGVTRTTIHSLRRRGLGVGS